MKTVEEICDVIGRPVLISKLGVTKQAISNACGNNTFPASWWVVLQALCEAAEIECPGALFNMKKLPSDPKEGAGDDEAALEVSTVVADQAEREGATA